MGAGALVTVFHLPNIYNGCAMISASNIIPDYDARHIISRQSTDMTSDIRYMNERFVCRK